MKHRFDFPACLTCEKRNDCPFAILERKVVQLFCPILEYDFSTKLREEREAKEANQKTYGHAIKGIAEKAVDTLVMN